MPHYQRRRIAARPRLTPGMLRARGRGRFAGRPNGATGRVLSTRLRHKRPSGTMVKRKSKPYMFDDRAGSMTVFNYGFRKMNPTLYKLSKSLSPQTFTINAQQLINGFAGFQLSNIIGSIFSPGIINTINQQSLQSQYQVTPYTNIVGWKTFDTLLVSASVEHKISNFSNNIVEFDIYDIINRRDAYTDQPGNPLDPKEAWSAGLLDQDGGSALDLNIIGSTPFSSKLFTLYFKVKRMRHVILAPGQMHLHKVHYAPQVKVNEEVMVQTNIKGIRNLTCYTMLVACGAPIKDNSGGITTSAPELAVISEYQYKTKYVPSDIRHSYMSNNLSATASTNAAFENLVTGAAAILANV